MSSVSSQANQEKALLTVRVDRDQLDSVKEYARSTDTTVSQLVRDFFRHLLADAEEKNEVEQL